MVQFCLADTHEIGDMTAIIRSVAVSNKLTFYDRSAETEDELKSIAKEQKIPIAHPTVNIGASTRDGAGFSAGNFAEAPAQIVIGFSKGDDPQSAHKLSDVVVRALARRWRIHEVPNVETSGAFPLKHCDEQRSAPATGRFRPTR